MKQKSTSIMVRPSIRGLFFHVQLSNCPTTMLGHGLPDGRHLAGLELRPGGLSKTTTTTRSTNTDAPGRGVEMALRFGWNSTPWDPKVRFLVLIAVVELLFDLTKEHEHLHPETAVALHPKTEESQFGLEKSVSDAPQSLIFRLLNQDLNKKPWGTHCGTTNSNLFISSLVRQLAIQGADCYDLFAVAKNVSYALLTGQLCLLRVGQPRDGQIHRRGSIMFPECLKRFPAWANALPPLLLLKQRWSEKQDLQPRHHDVTAWSLEAFFEGTDFEFNYLFVNSV